MNSRNPVGVSMVVSPACSQAVAASIRPAAKNACLPIDPDRLRGPKRVLGAHHVVPQGCKPADDGCGHGTLDLQGLAESKNSRRIDRRLNSHSVVDNIGEELNLTKGLKLAAGHAEWHHGLSLSCHHCRDDRI